MPNRLQDESSPYLQQHADNPVDWYPWCPEALAAAVEADRPIFLSIGYSACHWCHVMEHESFSDPEIAAFLNKHFISIKVDREERPDLDQIYMSGVMAVSGGRGGWPLNAFLMPDQKFFYGGTYWPPRAAGGQPGFLDVLKRVQQVYQDQRQQAQLQSQQMMQHISEYLCGRSTADSKSGSSSSSSGEAKSAEGSGHSSASSGSSTGTLPFQAGNPAAIGQLDSAEGRQRAASLVSEAVEQLIDSCDWQWGGFGDPPKFPHAMDIRFLFQLGHRIEMTRRRRKVEEGEFEAATLRMAGEGSLDRMAAGGIYDHIGGGFARYSVDAQWLVPHFEKMLYDNALLIGAYADAIVKTKRSDYQDVIRRTADYLQRDLRHASGGFYSSQDADSEGVEGKYYLWSTDEVKQHLQGDLGTRFCTAFDITLDGNFEGQNIPNRRKSIGVPVRELGLSEEELQQAIDKLLQVRQQRTAPQIDTKVLTSWNSLLIASLADAALATNDSQLLQMAEEAANFVADQMRREDGKLWHAWNEKRIQQGQSGGYLNAYLDDYAGMALALISLYRATWNESWLKWAFELAERILSDFRDPAGGFFYTSDDHEALAARGKDLQDSSVPSANSLTAACMWHLFRISNDRKYWDAFQSCVSDAWSLAERSPAAAGHLLATLDRSLGPNRELVLVLPADADRNLWRSKLGQCYLPNDLILVRVEDGPGSQSIPEIEPYFQGRGCLNGKPTLYVCTNRSCQAPIVGAEAVSAFLA